MLEIKFRAWDKRTKKMYEVVAIDWVDGKIITAHLKRQGEVRKVYPEEKYGDDIIFMQYTGESDKNKVEICTNDIIKIKPVFLGVPYVGVVKFINGAYIIELNKKQYVLLYDTINGSTYECAVAGNIYDNPELLVG